MRFCGLKSVDVNAVVSLPLIVHLSHCTEKKGKNVVIDGHQPVETNGFANIIANNTAELRTGRFSLFLQESSLISFKSQSDPI